jgi:rhodanese-related sulfurtransferase
MKNYRVCAIIFLAFIIVGMFSAFSTAQETYSDLTVEEVEARLESNPDIFLLDVRTPEEYSDDGHIPGAYLIPHTEIEARQDELPTDKNTEIIVYCRSGSRSRAASNILVNLGYTNVHNMLDGINDWKSSGFDTEYGPSNGVVDKLVVMAGAGIWVCAITLITFNALRDKE